MSPDLVSDDAGFPFAAVPPVRPGAAPGIDRHPELASPPTPGAVRVRCIEVGPDTARAFDVPIEELDALLASELPAGVDVRWVDVVGLHAWVVERFRAAYDLHGLAAEDVLHVPQRPKAEAYPGHLLVLARMLQIEGGSLDAEQVSLFLLPGVVLTFQERPGDVWDPVRRRIDEAGPRIRTRGAPYLLYALVDAIVDQGFPLLEHYGDQLEEIERDLGERVSEDQMRRLHRIKGELLKVRRTMWPMREVADELCRGDLPEVDEGTKTYFRDVHDHTLRVLDILESYREMAGSLTDLYLSSVSQRTNEVMKVLTILASLFIPVTFVAGVYGMNFENIPELRWKYAYPAFWVACAMSTAGLLVFFRRRGWL